MIDITQTLKDEHQNILRVMQLAEFQCADIEAGKPIDEPFFNELFDFIAHYVDKFHHAKEEDILFESMLRNEGHLHCNPVPVMLYEHNQGRDFLKEMRDALSRMHAEELIMATRSYIDLLSNHIFKEDQVLYPMAEDAIADDEKRRINEAYQKAEQHVKASFDIDKLEVFGR
ncbi:MAG: hemerythrin domain-containing protein [Mangrovibacterium sp.]